MENQAEPEEYKLVLVGEMGTGKTSIFKTLQGNEFRRDTPPTIMPAWYKPKGVVGAGSSYDNIIVWDLSGAERYREVNQSFYYNARAFIMVYDITNRRTWDELKNYWVQEARDEGHEETKIAIVGNKNDLNEKRAVARSQAESFCQEHGFFYTEMSCLHREKEKLDEMFQWFAAEFYKSGWFGKREKTEEPPAGSTDDVETTDGGAFAAPLPKAAPAGGHARMTTEQAIEIAIANSLAELRLPDGPPDTWTAEDLGDWIANLNEDYQKYGDEIKSRGITGKKFASYEKAKKLKSIGIRNSYHRDNIWLAFNNEMKTHDDRKDGAKQEEEQKSTNKVASLFDTDKQSKKQQSKEMQDREESLTLQPVFTVNDCGMPEFNGNYYLDTAHKDGVVNGRHCYRKKGVGDAGSECTIEWSNTSGGTWWMTNHYGDAYYYLVRSDADLPPKSGWSACSKNVGSPPRLVYEESDLNRANDKASIRPADDPINRNFDSDPPARNILPSGNIAHEEPAVKNPTANVELQLSTPQRVLKKVYKKEEVDKVRLIHSPKIQERNEQANNTNAISVTLNDICDQEVFSVEEVTQRYLLSTDKGTNQYLMGVLRTHLPEEGKEEYLKKIKHTKRMMKRKAKEHINMDEMKNKALRQVCEKTALIDETVELKQVLIWKLLYTGAEEKRKEVLAMGKEEINAKIMTFESRKEEVRLIMSRRDHWVTLWSNPESGLKEYDGYDPDGYNALIVGMSGVGKSTFINTFGKHFNMDWKAKTGSRETTMSRKKFKLHSGGIDFDAWDIPGCGTMNIQSGELGAEYIKKYCLLHFDLTILLMASNDTEFAKHLYKILTSQGKKVIIVRTKSDVDVEGLTQADKEAKQLQIKNYMMKTLGARSDHIYMSRNSFPYDDMQDLCLYCLKQFLDFCLGENGNVTSTMLEKLDSGTPVDWFVEEYGLDARGIEGLKAFQVLRDVMDEAVQSTEYRGKDEEDFLNEILDDSEDDDDWFESPVAVLESVDSENIMSLTSKSDNSPAAVQVHKHISFMVKEEIKQAIPHFYAAGADETFSALRKQKEREWKSHSKEEQARLRKVLDSLQEEIRTQQEMAASIREDLVEVERIDESEMPEFDEETQRKYDEIVEKQMQEKISAKIEKED